MPWAPWGCGNGAAKKEEGATSTWARGIFLLYGRFTLGVVGVTGTGSSLSDTVCGDTTHVNVGVVDLGSIVESIGEDARTMWDGMGYGMMYWTMLTFP